MVTGNACRAALHAVRGMGPCDFCDSPSLFYGTKSIYSFGISLSRISQSKQFEFFTFSGQRRHTRHISTKSEWSPTAKNVRKQASPAFTPGSLTSCLGSKKKLQDPNNCDLLDLSNHVIYYFEYFNDFSLQPRMPREKYY